MWQLKNLNCDVMVIKMTVVTKVVIITSFSKNTLTPWQPTNSQSSFSQFLRCFLKQPQKRQIQKVINLSRLHGGCFWSRLTAQDIMDKYPTNKIFSKMDIFSDLLCYILRTYTKTTKTYLFYHWGHNSQLMSSRWPFH